MRNKHKRILTAIFSSPINSSIAWSDIEALLVHLGADIEEGAGSRICIELNEVIAVFHRPHPRKETDKGAIKSLRKFLIEAGIYHV